MSETQAVLGATAGYLTDVYQAITSDRSIRVATKYLSPKHVVRITRRHRPDGRQSRTEYVVTVGAPNFRERLFVKAAKRAGEPFPVAKIQLLTWPKKRGGK